MGSIVVSCRKRDEITSGKPVIGAKLVILDKDGKEVESWVTEEKPHYIEKLPVGEYTLREITAPDGYLRAEDVKFTVKETGEIQILFVRICYYSFTTHKRRRKRKIMKLKNVLIIVKDIEKARQNNVALR